MSTNNDRIRVAALGDLHFQESQQGQCRDLFTEISAKADVLVLCGDLTNVGSPGEAKGLARDLEACSIPVVGVLGNHDYHCGQAEEVTKILTAANVKLLNGDGYEVSGVGFAGVKGFGGGFADHILASFGEETIKSFVAEAINESLKLEVGLQSLNTKHRVVVLHYAPVCETVQGEPVEIFPFLGCSRLAETIDRFDVAAVFHGHAHRGSPEGKTTKGIAVYNCCLEVLKARQREPYTLIEIGSEPVHALFSTG